MPTTVFLVVLFAALLHASWNGFVKHASDKFVSMGAVVIGHLPFAASMIFINPTPLEASWPYIIIGGLIHTGYQLFLIYSYRIGDFTQVYPIARGAAPMIIAFISVTFLGVHLGKWQLLGVALIGTGIMSLVIARSSEGLGNHRAGIMAFATGCFIAAYSLVDGTGARLAGTALAFYGYLSIVNVTTFVIILPVLQPGTIKKIFTSGRQMMVVGGGISALAYALVTWAFTQSPIALVSALRETSIMFALIIGIVFLKERVNLVKVASVALSLAGAMLLRLAK